MVDNKQQMADIFKKAEGVSSNPGGAANSSPGQKNQIWNLIEHITTQVDELMLRDKRTRDALDP